MLMGKRPVNIKKIRAVRYCHDYCTVARWMIHLTNILFCYLGMKKKQSIELKAKNEKSGKLTFGNIPLAKKFFIHQ